MDDSAVMDRIIYQQRNKKPRKRSKPKAKARCDKRGLTYNGQRTKKYLACDKALGHRGDCSFAEVTGRVVAPAKKVVRDQVFHVDLSVRFRRRKSDDVWNYDYRKTSTMEAGVADMVEWLTTAPDIVRAEVVIMDKGFNRLRVIEHKRRTRKELVCPKQTCDLPACDHPKVTKVARVRRTTVRDQRTGSVKVLQAKGI